MKSLHLLRHRCVRPLILATGLLLGSATASAEPLGQAPTESIEAAEAGALEGLETHRVQPVVLADASSAGDVGVTMVRASQLSEDAERAARLFEARPQIEGVAPQVDDEGLDFAGSSTKLDIISLKYGYLLGSLPMLKASSPKSYAGVLKNLGEMSSFNGIFDRTTRAQIERFVKAARAGQLDHVAYLGMMQAASRGIAQAGDPGVERRHGYLLVGLWSGLAQMSAETGQASAEVIATGHTLTRLLEEDAAHAGSDRAVAASVRAMTAQLDGGAPSSQAIGREIKKMMSVSHDA